MSYGLSTNAAGLMVFCQNVFMMKSVSNQPMIATEKGYAMKTEHYVTESPSMYNLQFALKEKGIPLRTTGEYPTMRVFYEALLPKELFACMLYKTKEANEKNSNATWLHRGDPAANGRRKEMLSLLKQKGRTGRSLIEAMRNNAEEQFTEAVGDSARRTLAKVLTEDEDCIPFPEEEADSRSVYLRYMRYYLQKDPAFALAAAYLLLLLGSSAAECLPLLFADGGDAETDRTTDAAQLLFEEGKYEKALKLLQEIGSAKSGADKAERARAKFLEGEFYRGGFAGKAEPVRAYLAYREAYGDGKEADSSVCYRLYEMALAEADGKKNAAKDALRYLKEACAKGHREAKLRMALYLAGEETLAGLKAAPEKALAIYREGAAEGDVDFLYGLGRMLERQGDRTGAGEAYQRALRAGHRRAAYALERLRMSLPGTAAAARKGGAKKESVPGRVIFYNEDSEAADIFVTSAKDAAAEGKAQWTVREWRSDDAKTWISRAVGGFLPKGKENFEWIVILAAKEDAKNVRDANALLSLLNSCADATVRRRLAEGITVFLHLRGDKSVAVLQTDALNALYESASSLGEGASSFRIRLCHRETDASLSLLSGQPFFMSPLQKMKHSAGTVLLWGDGDMPLVLAKDILSVSPFTGTERRKRRIVIVSPEAEAQRTRLRMAAPGLFEESRTGLQTAEIDCFEASDEEVMDALSRKETGDDPLAQALREAGMMIVCGKNDRCNAAAALRLREKTARLHLGDMRMPMLAAYIRDEMLARSLESPVADLRLPERCRGRYLIRSFGSAQRLYTYGALCKNRLEERAYLLHRSYYGNEEIANESAFGAYWSRFYNRESSRLSALGTLYAAAAAGFVLPHADDYGTETEHSLKEPYMQWLSDPVNLDLAAALEHERWRYMLLAAGYETASVAQAEQYIRAGVATHRHEIAKLHPYLCGFEELEERSRRFDEIIRTYLPDHVSRDIREADADVVLGGAASL